MTRHQDLMLRNMLGFADRLAGFAEQSTNAFPPYNIEAEGDDKIFVSVALAGFDPENVTVEMKGQKLLISGEKPADTKEERRYVHQGIAARKFSLSFMIAEDWEVKEAAFKNGVLTLDVLKKENAQDTKRIEIKS